MPDRIDVNAASEEELCEVLEIDADLAARIVELRAQGDGFAAVDDLRKIKGVDDQLFARMRERLIVDLAVGADASPTP